MLIADQLGDKHNSGHVTVDIYTPDPLPMPVAGADVGNALVAMMAGKGIGFHGNTTVTSIDVSGKTLTFADGGREAFDLLAVVPPHAPTATATSTGLGPAGWIPVDPKTLATQADGVWAIGDATALLLANGKPLPKAAVFAEAEAHVVAHQVARFLGYQVPDKQFTGDGACYVEVGAHHCQIAVIDLPGLGNPDAVPSDASVAGLSTLIAEAIRQQWTTPVVYFSGQAADHTDPANFKESLLTQLTELATNGHVPTSFVQACGQADARTMWTLGRDGRRLAADGTFHRDFSTLRGSARCLVEGCPVSVACAAKPGCRAGSTFGRRPHSRGRIDRRVSLRCPG